jgi:hypothetical protein
MANLAARAYGIGAPVMGSFVGPEMMGTDGRIYGTSSVSAPPPVGVRLFRAATKAEIDQWRYQSGKGGTPTSFDVRAEVAAYDQRLAIANAGPKPSLGTTSNDLAPEVKGGILGFSGGATLVIAIVLGAVVFGGK